MKSLALLCLLLVFSISLIGQKADRQKNITFNDQIFRFEFIGEELKPDEINPYITLNYNTPGYSLSNIQLLNANEGNKSFFRVNGSIKNESSLIITYIGQTFFPSNRTQKPSIELTFTQEDLEDENLRTNVVNLDIPVVFDSPPEAVDRVIKFHYSSNATSHDVTIVRLPNGSEQALFQDDDLRYFTFGIENSGTNITARKLIDEKNKIRITVDQFSEGRTQMQDEIRLSFTDRYGQDTTQTFQVLVNATLIPQFNTKSLKHKTAVFKENQENKSREFFAYTDINSSRLIDFRIDGEVPNPDFCLEETNEGKKRIVWNIGDDFIPDDKKILVEKTVILKTALGEIPLNKQAQLEITIPVQSSTKLSTVDLIKEMKTTSTNAIKTYNTKLYQATCIVAKTMYKLDGASEKIDEFTAPINAISVTPIPYAAEVAQVAKIIQNYAANRNKNKIKRVKQTFIDWQNSIGELPVQLNNTRDLVVKVYDSMNDYVEFSEANAVKETLVNTTQDIGQFGINSFNVESVVNEIGMGGKRAIEIRNNLKNECALAAETYSNLLGQETIANTDR